MTGTVGFDTHQGPRKSNQDTVKVPQMTPGYAQHISRSGALFLLADGMGGYKGGKQASELAVHHIESFFYKNANLPIEIRLRDALFEAHHAIREVAQRDAELSGMGTTIVAVAVMPTGQYYVINAGDSPCWLVRRTGEVIELTTAHSWVAQQARSGTISHDQVRRHQMKNILTMALGMEEPLQPALNGPRTYEAGDVLVMMSDGVSNFFSEREVVDLLRACGSNYQQAASELVRQAIQERQSNDNCSAIVIPLANAFATHTAPPVPARGDRTQHAVALPVPGGAPVGARNVPRPLVAGIATVLFLFLALVLSQAIGSPTPPATEPELAVAPTHTQLPTSTTLPGQPTSTPAPTFTPPPQLNVNTDLEGVASTRTPTPTNTPTPLPPTATVPPSATKAGASPTPRGSATPTATQMPQGGGTIPNQPVFTSTSVPPRPVYNQAPVPRDPKDTTLESEFVTFSWEWNGGELAEGDQFAVMAWEAEGGQPRLAGYSRDTRVVVNMRAFGGDHGFEKAWRWYVVVFNPVREPVAGTVSREAIFSISLPTQSGPGTGCEEGLC